jgi:N-dimethylarginine dimethylaminohydrolase
MRTGERAARQLTLVMCEPSYFDVVYSVNPWMDLDTPVDRDLARRQWETLYDTLVALGHEVMLIDPLPGQPDMVFTANAAVVVGTRGVSAKFRAPYRNPETVVYHEWLQNAGINMRAPTDVSEGEGDFVVTPDGARIFAGDGVRTKASAHTEISVHLGLPTIPLTLVDERFYHLDTALSILDDHTAIYYPPAFSQQARDTLSEHFKDLISADDRDAFVLGANAVSDGLHVLLEAEADGLMTSLTARGYQPVPLDMSEFRKSGGAVRCCVLELYASTRGGAAMGERP